MPKALSADELQRFRTALADSDISLEEIADLTGLDPVAVNRQFDGEEPLHPRVCRVAVQMLDEKLLDLMIQVIHILQVKGKTEQADALADMVNRELLD